MTGRVISIPPGTRFNQLSVIRLVGVNSRRERVFLCLCSCGAHTEVTSYSLRKGATKSCGCLRLDGSRSRTHGKSRRNRTYRAWALMRNRCLNEKAVQWARYGGRGIRIAPQWDDFARFLEDMGERPTGMELDRIDNDGNYEPGNCRWASRKTQNRNTSANRVVTAFGRSACIGEWAESTGLPYMVLYKRIRKGWNAERALTTPHRKGRA